MFKDMELRLKQDLVMFIENIDGVMATLAGGSQVTNQTISLPGHSHEKSADKVGRNDPCPCGSGKKWKKCGELNTQEHQTRMISK
jgi:preprotein translocase subunit SecA